MENDQLIPALMFFTLGAAVILGVVSFLYFLRKRSNRDAAKRAFDVNER